VKGGGAQSSRTLTRRPAAGPALRVEKRSFRQNRDLAWRTYYSVIQHSLFGLFHLIFAAVSVHVRKQAKGAVYEQGFTDPIQHLRRGFEISRLVREFLAHYPHNLVVELVLTSASARKS
jgi:hypothetical protein